MPSCVTADGYAAAETIRYNAVSLASTIKQTVLVAQFALNAQDAYQQFKKLSDISSRGIAIEEQQHARLKSVYWPAESQMPSQLSSSLPVVSSMIKSICAPSGLTKNS